MSNTNGKGIPFFYQKPGDQLFTANVVPASIELGNAVTRGNPANGIPIAANKSLKVRFWVKFTVGATGGVRAIVTVPAGGVIFGATIRLNNTVAPSQTIAVQQASAAFTNALANAGTHWIEIELFVRNGTTAGTVDLQMAQNTSDALTLTVLAGATAEGYTIENP